MTTRDAGRDKPGLTVLASETFDLEGDVHRLVTFLNQSLKEHSFVFGLTRAAEGQFRLVVYRAD